MVIEIVAGRVMAPDLGVSLYTWTSIIGMVLTGITAGNFLGGKIADKTPSTGVLGLMFLVSAGAVAAINYWAMFFHFGRSAGAFAGFPLIYATLLYSFVVFFPPAFFLSMVTPMVVKLRLTSLGETGRTVGKIYATSALGSIVGTFVTGYWLIAWFGTRFLVGLVAAMLALVGIWVIGKWQFKLKSLLMLVLFLGGAFWLPSPCDRESQYYCLVEQETGESKGGLSKILKLDNLIHSYVHASTNGTIDEFGYDYELFFALLMAAQNDPDDEFSTLTLGGGGYVGPRYIRQAYPNSQVAVAEIDPAVTKFVHSNFGLRENGDIEVYHEDARQYLKSLPEDKKFDYIFTDVFNDLSVPYHLVTSEFAAIAKARLAPGGWYAVNIIDNYEEGRFSASFIATLQDNFAQVYLFPLSPDWKKRERVTLVILASDNELAGGELKNTKLPIAMKDWESMSAENKAKITYMVPEEEMMAYMEEKEGFVLTDDFVPVEKMLAPLFANKAY